MHLSWGLGLRRIRGTVEGEWRWHGEIPGGGWTEVPGRWSSRDIGERKSSCHLESCQELCMAGTQSLTCGMVEDVVQNKAGERSLPHPEGQGYCIRSFKGIWKQIFSNHSLWTGYSRLSQGPFVLGSSSKAMVLQLQPESQSLEDTLVGLTVRASNPVGQG